MPKGFHQRLIALLKSDARFVDDAGELVTAAVMDRAWKIDHGLVRLLLSCADIKAKFFDEIDGHWVFNTNTFIDYVSDKNFLANSYTRFRNRIGLNIDDKFLRERGEVSLVWPYKDCVLEGGQTKEEEKRRELFFHEVLAQDEIDRLFDPKVLTNWRRYTVDGAEEVTAIKRDGTGTMQENLNNNIKNRVYMGGGGGTTSHQREHAHQGQQPAGVAHFEETVSGPGKANLHRSALQHGQRLIRLQR